MDEEHHDINIGQVTTNENNPVASENWFHSYWRPATAWLYFMLVAFDFILAPICTFWFFWLTKQPYVAWEPITLRGGGIVHVTLGGIIGVYTWNRTQEKLQGVATDGETPK